MVMMRCIDTQKTSHTKDDDGDDDYHYVDGDDDYHYVDGDDDYHYADGDDGDASSMVMMSQGRVQKYPARLR